MAFSETGLPTFLMVHIERVNALLAQQITAVLAPYQLDLPQWGTMQALRASTESDGMSPGALARELNISPAAMTHRLDVLEAAELVQRRPNPDDRRALRVKLTKAGRTTVDRLMPKIRAVVETALSDLTKRQQEEISRLLAKIEVVLEAPAKPDAPATGPGERAG